MGLKCPDAAIRFTRTIPLRNGLQIRADAKCSPMGWKRFLEEANIQSGHDEGVERRGHERRHEGPSGIEGFIGEGMAHVRVFE